jgi:hypothetical protein
MTDSEPAVFEDFRQALAKCGADYLMVSPCNGKSARIRFLGVFEDAPVIWDATIRALACGRPEKGGVNTTPQRQYLEIAPKGLALRCITVGLNVAAIDPPALLKTIIMVRKYKRLHAGRHEFGTATVPGDD